MDMESRYEREKAAWLHSNPNALVMEAVVDTNPLDEKTLERERRRIAESIKTKYTRLMASECSESRWQWQIAADDR